METQRLPSVQKFSYGTGHVFNDLSGTMWFTYVLVYLQFVIKLPASTAGIILMVGQFAEAIFTPISGIESDNVKGFGNYGRRKSCHLVGTILTMISFPLIFIALPGFDKSSDEALLVYYIPLVLINKIGWSTVQVSHLSLIPELSSDATDRDDLTILRYIFDAASDMLVYFVTWSAFITRTSDSVTIDQTDGWRFRNIALILLATGVLFNGVFHFLTVEKPPQENMLLRTGERRISKDGIPVEIVPMKWSDWFREKHYFQVGLLLVIARLFLNLNQAFMPLFLQEGIRAPQEYLAIIPGVCQLSALLASGLVKIVMHYGNKRLAVFTGAAFAFTGLIWLGFDSPENVRAGSIFPLAAFLGAGIGMITVVATSFVSDLIGDNTESGAYVFGSIAFIHNLLNGLIVFLVQMGHGFCENCPTYYKNFLTHGLSSLAMIAVALVIFLDTKKLGERLSGSNTVEGREKLVEDKRRKYGSTNTGFPILERPLEKSDSSEN